MKVLTRMIVVFLVSGVLATVIMQFFMQKKLKAVYLRPIEDDLVDISMVLASLIEQQLTDDVLRVSDFAEMVNNAVVQEVEIKLYDRVKTELGLHVYITDREASVIYDSRGLDVGKTYDWRDVRRTLRGTYGARATWDRSGPVHRLHFYVGAPIIVNDQIIGVVSAGKLIPNLGPIYEDMRKEALLGGGLAIVVSTILGLLFLVWITRPISQLNEYAKLIRDGHRASLPHLGNSDIGELGKSFDEMRDALEGKAYVEQYVQTLTHEIKSPLSAIRGAAELLEEDMPPERRASFMKNIRTEGERIQRLVDRMLQLSELEKKKELDKPTDVDLVKMAREIVNSMKPAAEKKQITINLTEKGPFAIVGEAFMLRQAVVNLVSNALDFTPVKGKIDITITDKLLTVHDSGPGVPEYAKERVFERFYSLQRPDSGKKSSGLGLSIVKQVAELHGCEIALDNHPEGGAVATLRLVKERPRRLTIPPKAFQTLTLRRTRNLEKLAKELEKEQSEP